jgi:hypothetical protein
MNDICNYVQAELVKMKLDYRSLTTEERDKWILFVLKHIKNLHEYDRAGKKRISDWQRGWRNNSNIGTLIPGYFGKYPIVRMDNEFVKSTNNKFFELEYFAFAAVQRYVFSKYIPTIEHVYEFGCGTGHNLLRISEANQKLRSIVGLDWVNSTLDNIDNIQKFLLNVSGEKFNMFEPDFSYRLNENSAVCTIASMEQLGSNFQKFFHYLLSNKPRYVIHIEPINELLDPESNLLDYLSVSYARKRNYLNAYLDYLRIMESGGLINIICAMRSYVGSLFVDGYSVVIWECV